MGQNNSYERMRETNSTERGKSGENSKFGVSNPMFSQSRHNDGASCNSNNSWKHGNSTKDRLLSKK